MPIPEGYHTVTPALELENAAGAIEFYKRAFGAREIGRMAGPDGKSIMHAEIEIGDSRLMLNDPMQPGGAKPVPGTASSLHLYVENADAVFKSAVEAGAKVVMPLENAFWGDRYGVVVDPFGLTWGIATHIEDPSEDEIARRMKAAMPA
jgi:PhnB protein